MVPSTDLDSEAGCAPARTAGVRLTPHELTLVLLGVVLATALAYFNLARLTADTDMFWHIANGREMSQTHSIPEQDNLSWYGAERGLRTSTHEWLYDYAAFQVFSVGGFRLLYVATSLLFGVLFALLFTLTWMRTRRGMTSLTVAVLSIAGIAQGVAPRPQSVSFVLLVATAVLLERRRWLAVLPLVLLAANVHGGTYPLFLALIAYYAYREKPALIAAATACAVVNPQGLALLSLPFQSLGNPAGSRYIQEFQPATVTNDWLLFATLIALGLLLRNRRVPLVTGMFALALVCMSLVSTRYGAYVYLIALPLLAPYFPTGRSDVPTPSAADSTRAQQASAPRWLRIVLVGELAIAAIVLLALDARAEIDADKGYPRAAADYVENHRITRVFNFYDQGGYLLYAGVPTLIDGRYFQFGPILNEGESLLSEYMDVVLLRSDYRPFLDRLNIRFLLLQKLTPFCRALSYDPTVVAVYEKDGYTLLRWDPSTR